MSGMFLLRLPARDSPEGAPVSPGTPLGRSRRTASAPRSVAAAVTVPTPNVVTGIQTRPVRQTNTAWARFRRDRVATAALIMLGVVVMLAISAPVVSPDPFAVDLDAVKKAPSAAHLLGTDSAGRDVLARLLYAARVSMSVGLVAVAIATCIGTLVGLTAGYAGGGVDNLLMRLTEFVQTFPLFFAVVILVGIQNSPGWPIR